LRALDIPDGGRRQADRGGRPTAKIVWSPQQSEALTRIERWRSRSERQTYYLAGYAGTGKTTLAREVARRLGGNVAYGAFTGKAASVMRRKGCDDADTIDSLIYRPRIQIACAGDPPCASPPCDNRCRFLRERFIGRELNTDSVVAAASLIIIDEASMIDAEMARDLLSFSVKTLVLSDPAQLPPTSGAGYFTNREPDFLLTEVHRQAFDSPIIKLATRVREGWQLKIGKYGDSAVVADLPLEDLLEFNQVIVGTHRTRCNINGKMREALGFASELPQPGEKLVCLRNDRRNGLRNGTMWHVVSVNDGGGGFLDLTVADEDDPALVVDAEAPIDAFGLPDNSGGELPGNPFDFGYSITAHKSQGSQWDAVAVIDESPVFHHYGTGQQWLYTAITRAAKRVTVVS
jgi:ATP-dependent exoDNAse (exonuclease V) alpha subunit